jgi:predicted nucleic acid-binding protein
MILVDTSVLVAWLDPRHPHHRACTRALEQCGAVDELAISSVTFAELAAGGRNREALDEDLQGFTRIPLDFDAAFRAGQAFGRYRSGKEPARPVLVDFFIPAQAALLGMPHLTNDRRRLAVFPDVDFLFPQN